MPSAPPAPIRRPVTATREPANGSRRVTTNLSGNVRLPSGLVASAPPGAAFSARSGVVAFVTTQSAPFRVRQPITRASASEGSSVRPSFWHNLHVGNGVASKLGGSRGKAVGLQHERDDIPVGGFVEGAGGAVRHVRADELEQIAHAFLRETLPEWVAHQRRLACCCERMTASAALAEGSNATGGLSLRVHTVPDGPARGAGLSSHETGRD